MTNVRYLVGKLVLGMTFMLSPICHAQTPTELYSPNYALSVSTEYSNNSNHLLVGNAYNRRFAGGAVTLSRRLKHTSVLDWNFDVEVRPLEFIQDPVSTIINSSNLPGAPVDISSVISGPIAQRCTSYSVTVTNSYGYLDAFSRTCGSRWTYAGGVSPLGQRISFFPKSRVHPFALINAGFLASTQDVPSDNSSRFDFTVTTGAGLELYGAQGRSMTVGYAIQHFSNGGLGSNNGGIDSQFVRVEYRIPVAHRKRL